MRIGRLYDVLHALDDVVAKAARVSPDARMDRIERLMQQYLGVEWDRLASRAARAAERTIAGRKLKRGDVGRVVKAVDREMEKWAPRVTKRWIRDAERIYKLGRKNGLDKGRRKKGESTVRKAPPKTEFGITFDLVDEEAVGALKRNQTFWIGQHYSANVRKVVRDVARETIVEQGYGQIAAGKVMEQAVRGALKKVTTPTGWVGTDKSYFQGLAANAATTARVQGQLKSFGDLDFTRYEWVNPSDRRTCSRCDHLNGKTFEVKHGQRMMGQELAARRPADVRKIHPWVSFKQIQAVSPRAGHVSRVDSANLAKAGIALPPVHFKCRCTVDVA